MEPVTHLLTARGGRASESSVPRDRGVSTLFCEGNERSAPQEGRVTTSVATSYILCAQLTASRALAAETDIV